MSLAKHFKTRKDWEKEGVRVDYGLNSKGKPMVFIIARSGGANQEYLNYLEVLTKPHRRMIQNETADNKLLEGILKKAFIAKSLRGWENVEAEWEPMVDGAYPDLPFSQANAERLYEEMPELYRDHQDMSTKTAIYLDDIREAEAKNS
jgi:hypothetical protein